MGCAGSKISESIAEQKLLTKQSLETMKDDVKESMLARRAKGAVLDDTVMTTKKRAKDTEDAIDGAIYMYSVWAARKTDMLRLPSLAVWAQAKPFIGGEAASKAVLAAAIQQVNLTALLLEWRAGAALPCVGLLKKAKQMLRDASDLCNTYIEGAILEKAAVEKHNVAAAAAEKAKAALDEVSKDLETQADDEAGGADKKQKALDAKKRRAEECEAAAAAAATAREAAEVELARTRSSVIEETGRMASDAERAVGDAFKLLRSGYEELAFKATGLLASPEFAEQNRAVHRASEADGSKAEDEGCSVMGESSAGAVGGGISLVELMPNREGQAAGVDALLQAVEVADHQTKAAVKRLGKWAKHGLRTALGPPVESGAVKAARSEGKVLGVLLEQLATPEIKLLVEGALLDNRAATEEGFVSGALSEYESSTKLGQAALAPIGARCKEWLSGRKKEAEAQLKLEKAEATKVKAEAAAEKAAEKAEAAIGEADEKSREKAEAAAAKAKAASDRADVEQKKAEVAEMGAKLQAEYEALVKEAQQLQGTESGSVTALFVAPLQGCATGPDSPPAPLTGLDWTGRDCAGLDWTGLDPSPRATCNRLDVT